MTRSKQVQQFLKSGGQITKCPSEETEATQDIWVDEAKNKERYNEDCFCFLGETDFSTEEISREMLHHLEGISKEK